MDKFPRIHCKGNSRIQKMMTELHCEPEQFKGRIIFTLYEKNEEKQKHVLRILLQLRIMLADSCWDVGHFWDLDQRINGTELVLINQMEIGTKLLKAWCSTLPKAVTQYFVPPAPWKEENKKAKERERSLFTSTVVKKPLK